MGHLNYVDVDLIDFYLKTNGIYNVNIPKYLNNSLSYIQNHISSNNKILFQKSKIHDEIFHIIKQNNLFNNYILKKDFIISKMLYDNKNLKKAKKNKIYDLKKKIEDAIQSKRLSYIISFENK